MAPMAMDSGGQIIHAAAAKPGSEMSDNASDRGRREFLVLPYLLNKLQMRDILIGMLSETI